MVAVALIFSAWVYFDQQKTSSEPMEEPSSVASGDSEAPPPNSVAILPFRNLSPDPDHAGFANGIHGDVLNQVAKIGSLEVKSSTA